MLVWLSVAALGFVALTAVVLALGTRSTAHHEAERDRVRRSGSEQPPNAPASAGRHPAGGPVAAVPGQSGPRPPHAVNAVRTPAAEPQRTAVGVLADPAAHRTFPVEDRSASAGWWLVTEPGDGALDHGALDGGAVRVVAGPFADRLAADWAALAGGLPAAAGARAVHGVRGADGVLVLRPSTQEHEWLAELGEPLDRLAADWDAQVPDTDPLTTLVVEVTAALLDAGLALHDCDGSSPAGGVCLTPEPGSGGILVSWRAHDRMSVHQAWGATVDAAVQQAMSAVIADVLTYLGLAVEPFGTTGCHLVTAAHR
jgi:hypothetical protein